MQTYEDFFLIEDINDGKYARTIIDEKITILNVKNIFINSNIDKFDKIEDKNILDNHAFAVSMEFRHEKNSHQKKNLKNKMIESPIYYFDNGKIKFIEYIKKENKKERKMGEDGRLIEYFIDMDRNIINSLQTDIIYGKLLKVDLFTKENFIDLKTEMNKIKKEKNKFKTYFKTKLNIEKNSNINNSIEINNNETGKKKGKFYSLIKNGEIMIFDQEYKIEEIKDMINHAKKTNTYHLLSDFLIEIDKELNLGDSDNK